MDERYQTRRDMDADDRPIDTTETTETIDTTDRVDDGETHATTGGAAAAGAITGGVIGLTAGPAGAAIGAIGGAIVGAASERLMHNDDDVVRTPTGERHVDRDTATGSEAYVEREPVERSGMDRPMTPTTESYAVTARNDTVGDRTPVTVGGGASTTTTWQSVMPRYRERWQQRYGTTGGRWEDYEPAYSYGWSMRDRPEYRGRSWTDVEPEFQRDWTTRHPEIPWDRAREGIRDTWEDLAT